MCSESEACSTEEERSPENEWKLRVGSGNRKRCTCCNKDPGCDRARRSLCVDSLHLNRVVHSLKIGGNRDLQRKRSVTFRGYRSEQLRCRHHPHRSGRSWLKSIANDSSGTTSVDGELTAFICSGSGEFHSEGARSGKNGVGADRDYRCRGCCSVGSDDDRLTQRKLNG